MTQPKLNNSKRSLSKLLEKNPQWKGDNVEKKAVHDWIRSRLRKPTLCSNCWEFGFVELANISQEYKRDLSDWKWLCRKCHMKQDKRTGHSNVNKNHPGHWVDCINPFCNPVAHAFFSHIPPTISDLQKLCGVCWYKAGHLEPVYVPSREGPKNSRIDSKPEKDTL